MQEKPVFVSEERFPYFYTVLVPFETVKASPEMKSLIKRKVECLHERFGHIYPEKKVLEISSASEEDEGKELRSECLSKIIPSGNTSVPVDNVFRGSCVFEEGGPYPEMFNMTSLQLKRDRRLKESGMLTHYCFEGSEYPKRPRTAFYYWIYVNALLENRELAEKVIQYDAFSDISCNPGKKPFGAARGAALFTALSRLDLLDQAVDFASFHRLMSAERWR